MSNKRAERLEDAGTPYIVVGQGEDYYPVVYRIIRAAEQQAGTWSDADEAIYLEAIRCWAAGTSV